MTSELHAELAALVEGFSTRELSEEEWALLQVHMAYCDSCRIAFLEMNGDVSRDILTGFLG
jgi:hypothetical protein